MHIIKKRADEDLDLYREEPTQNSRYLKLSLPIPPSVNKMYYNTRGGGKRLTNKAERYVRDARALINEAIEEQKWVMPNKYVWLYADMVFYFPDRRIRDSHNCLKLLLDTLQGKVFVDDYSALPRIQSVEYDKENPRVEIHITPQTANNRLKGLKTTQVVV